MVVVNSTVATLSGSLEGTTTDDAGESFNIKWQVTVSLGTYTFALTVAVLPTSSEVIEIGNLIQLPFNLIDLFPMLDHTSEITNNPVDEYSLGFKVLINSPPLQTLLLNKLFLSFTEWLLKGYQHKR